MSFKKLAELAEEFAIKLIEHQYENDAPEDIKSSDLDALAAQDVGALSLKERSQLKGHGPSNLLVDDNAAVDEKIWNRAKKVVKKYWNKYDEPWAVVYDVYRKMGGKAKKKPKK
jgi:hypothetical protein